MNLSSFQLSQAEVSLLDKGLTFVPTVKFVPQQAINECTERNIRNLKLKDYFKEDTEDYNPNDFKHKFCARNSWSPDMRKLSKETTEAITDIYTFTDSYLDKYRSTLQSSNGPLIRCDHTSKDNLTPHERAAIRKLKDNHEIIIKPADKGGAVVIMDREAYKQEGLRQLLNTKYYREITCPTATTTSQQINEVIDSIWNKGFISTRQREFLRTTPPTTNRPFYLLPKVHKPRNKWPTVVMPEGRPIVSDTGSETYYICQLIDHYLQPLATKHEAYIKDTYDFIAKIKGLEIPSSAFLVTGDVCQLYTNMDISRSIEAIRAIFAEYPCELRPDEEILQLLELTLRNNEFEFAGRLFLQILGTAMGKAFAPSLANIYLRKFDSAAVNHRPDLIRLYSRFIDDVFFVWLGSKTELTAFESYMNSVIPGIRITLKVKSCIIDFLDVLVYKTQMSTDNNSILQTRIHFKSTDTHQLLDGSSFHPKHTARGILKSQLTRFKRISTTKEDYNDSCRILFNVLKHRGYKKSLFRKVKATVWHTDQSLNRNSDHHSNQIWPIINLYDSTGTKLAPQFRNRIKSLNCARDKRLILAFKKHRNLRQILTSSRFDDIHCERDLGNCKIGITRCPDTKCKACNYITESTNVTSSTNKRTYKLNSKFSCRSRNLIYLITCKKCHKQYVGETGRTLKQRITDHISCIRLHKDTPIGLHFNLPGHDTKDLSIIPIEQLYDNSDSVAFRRMKESAWQRALQTLHPLGLNAVNRNNIRC